MILAGDIGGTSTRLALFDDDARAPRALEVYPSQQHSGPEEMVEAFLASHPATVDRAAFGAAGAVRGGRCVDTTNLAWPVDAHIVAEAAGVAAVKLLNDLEANAWGVATLERSDFAVLNRGTEGAVGHAAVVSAGTGLGQAGLYWDGRSTGRSRPRAATPTSRRATSPRKGSAATSSGSSATSATSASARVWGSRACLDKGRFRQLLERIPVYVILNDKTALLGAARAAAEGA